MARSKDARAAAELGANLTRLHKKAGKPGFKGIERALWDRGLSIDAETIRLYHSGLRDPAHIDVAVAVALGDFYNVEVGAVHPSFTERAVRTYAVLARFAMSGEQPASSSTWNTASVAA